MNSVIKQNIQINLCAVAQSHLAIAFLYVKTLTVQNFESIRISDTIVQVFLEQGASVWVLRTNQVGGNDPDIAPINPMTL
ncbi:MAG: hypothetical protein LH679_02920 [Cyanobacteria bacterium CAN_BIN43]|nr:hypothetical protein [Cyanobacteria bacterium CAN_BIN43]